MTIGERIKHRRIELGLSQEDLAKRLGNKSRASVCTVEKDKEDLTTDRIRKYAKALETTPAYLMGWDDFTDEVTKGKVDLDEMNHAMHMYELYKKSSPKVQSMVEYLLDEGNSKEASQQD